MPDFSQRELNHHNRLSVSRRKLLQIGSGLAGLSLPNFLQLKSAQAKSATQQQSAAKSCIVLFCWGGMSHIDTLDPKPHAPKNVRGEFKPIDTATPGIQFTEHLPLLAQQTEHLAVIRSIHHGCSAHGKGMYWNMTGHPPLIRAGNSAPARSDWPSLAAMVSAFREGKAGLPPAVRLPYPLVDNGTLQAGESGGWMGVAYDPIVIRTPKGKPYGGVSRDLGSPVLNLSEGIDRPHLRSRRSLLNTLERPVENTVNVKTFKHFHELGLDMLANPQVTEAFNLDAESAKTHAAYGDHICGQSVLLARRLSEAGVPITTVVCAAGDLNGSRGDHWDTHGDNFNRLKNAMLPPFDRSASALIADLHDRGKLDETLVVMMGDFGRTPKINGGAGRDHYPYSFSVALAGGGIRGGQVYGRSDKIGAFPANLPCEPKDLHATIFEALGISPDSILHDNLNRPHQICDGSPLPLF